MPWDARRLTVKEAEIILRARDEWRAELQEQLEVLAAMITRPWDQKYSDSLLRNVDARRVARDANGRDKTSRDFSA